MAVVPIAGHDSFLLNLSGGHGPVFVRNLVVLEDNAGHVGVGETPGGEAIRETLVQAVNAGCDDLVECAASPCCPLPFPDIVDGSRHADFN